MSDLFSSVVDSLKTASIDARHVKKRIGEVSALDAFAAKRVADGEPERPEAVTAAGVKYQHDNDLLGQFIDEECCQGEGIKCGSTEFFNAINQWSGGRCGSQRDVSRWMENRGFEKGKLSGGRIAWLRIALKTNDLQTEEPN